MCLQVPGSSILNEVGLGRGFIVKSTPPKIAWTLCLEYVKMIVSECHSLVTGTIQEVVALGYLPPRT